VPRDQTANLQFDFAGVQLPGRLCECQIKGRIRPLILAVVFAASAQQPRRFRAADVDGNLVTVMVRVLKLQVR
jgi:hypothetical protein